MSFLKRRSTRLYVGMFLILTMALWSLPTTALADSGTATVAVTAGTLTEVGDFTQAKGSVALIGFDEGLAYFLPIQVTDATGSGAGWHLQISGTPLSDGVNGHPTLMQAEGAVQFVGCAPGSTCTPPNGIPRGVFIVNTPVEFYSVSQNSGMGVIDLATLISAVVPGNAFAGTYTGTLTLGIVSGP